MIRTLFLPQWCQEYCICTHLIVFAVDECQFEAVLGGVYAKSPGLGVAVQAVDCGPSHQRDVDGQIQGPDDAVVTGIGGREGLKERGEEGGVEERERVSRVRGEGNEEKGNGREMDSAEEK